MSEWQQTEIGVIPSCWKCNKVSELVDSGILAKPLDGNHGGIHPNQSDFVDDGVPFVMASDLSNFKVNLAGCKFISKDQADNLRKGFAVTGDVLLTHKATLGRTAIVGNIETPYLMLTPQVTYYRINDHQELNNEFLMYYFASSTFQEVLENHGSSGSTRKYIGITAQLDLPILHPPIEDQKAIASVLSSLDDKIDLLQRQNRTLEALAQTLFRHWFVDGAEEEWEEVKLGAFFPVITGKKDANFSTEDGEYPFFTCAQKAIWAPSYSFEGKAILLAGNGDFNVKRYDGKFEAYQRTYVLMPHNPEYFGFLYTLVKYHLQDITGYARGSVIRFITKGMITDFEFSMPTHKSEELIDKLHIFNKLFEMVDFNNAQIGTLEKLRDTLLPKLMSGEVRVRF